MNKNQTELKKIVVTGACGGIGEAMVNVFLNDGYFVIATGRDQNKLNNLKIKFEKTSDKLSTEVLDLEDLESIKFFSDKIINYGPLYGIVNNAGTCIIENIDEKKEFKNTVLDWEKVMMTNLNSVFYLIKLNLKKIQNPGRIVNISSQLGKEGRAGFSAYCASKFGMIGMTKCLAKELGKIGITVNAICPGWVETEMAKKDLIRFAEEAQMDKDEYYRKICEPIELRRFTAPSEVADLVSFLLSNKGGAITGRDWLIHTIWNQI